MFQHKPFINFEQNGSSIKFGNLLHPTANYNSTVPVDLEITERLAQRIAAILHAELSQEIREKQLNAAIAPPTNQEASSLQSEENFVTVMELLCRVA